MELSLSSAGGRREERLPLDVLVELRSDEGEDVLEADGLDVSPHGMAVRASFVPPVGAHLRCQFRCPPEGEPVRAEGEVVWGEWTGPRVGTFGMRFLALDTKSATVIRHYLEPERVELPPPEPEPQRVATMRIEGLSVPVEAEVRLADAGRVVLEQELGFLKLGRAVELDVPSRGRQRGRIGSIELRHTHLDVPTLVFGILLDEVKEAEKVAIPQAERLLVPERAEARPALERPSDMAELDALLEGVAAPSIETGAVNMTEAASPADVAELTAPASVPAEEQAADEVDQYLVRRVEEPRAEAPVTARRAVSRKRDSESRRVLTAAEQAQAEADELALAKKKAIPLAGVSAQQVLVAWLVRLRAVLVPLWGRVEQLVAQLRGESGPRLKAGWQRSTGQFRRFGAAQWQRLVALRTARAEPRQQRTTAPAPRVQRGPAPREPQRDKAVREQRPSRAQVRNRRVYAAALALTGVGLGIYALAPRSGADRMRIAHESLRPAPALAVSTTPAQEPQLAAAQPALVSTSAAPTPSAEGAPSSAPQPAAAVDAAPGDPKILSFGEREVANGRTFVLRMSGPVEGIEGERREDGFTVRVPGRLALDRASPIATSHRAVARAMVLNRGDYAELTVDFLPGMRPKYQVVARDSSIEVTLERQ